MIVYSKINRTPSTTKHKRKTIKQLQEKNAKKVYVEKPIFAPRGNHTLVQ